MRSWFLPVMIGMFLALVDAVGESMELWAGWFFGVF